MEIGKAAFLTRSEDRVYECLRSAAGLGVENIHVDVFLLGAPLPSPGENQEIDDLLEMIDDLEGRVFDGATIPELAEMLKNYDLIVPF
jgi:hypothetical protein